MAAHAPRRDGYEAYASTHLAKLEFHLQPVYELEPRRLQAAVALAADAYGQPRRKLTPQETELLERILDPVARDVFRHKLELGVGLDDFVPREGLSPR